MSQARQTPAEVRSAPARRPVVRRLLGAALVCRLELRPLAALDAGLLLIAWLRRPSIEMRFDARRLHGSDTARAYIARLHETYPF